MLCILFEAMLFWGGVIAFAVQSKVWVLSVLVKQVVDLETIKNGAMPQQKKKTLKNLEQKLMRFSNHYDNRFESAGISQ